jgi:DNA invertase Pin-like site-specific DNA recombinase
MESQRRSERTKAGLVRVVAQGKKFGRPLGLKDKKRRKRKFRESRIINSYTTLPTETLE